MSNFIDFISLITDEVRTLLEVVPDYIQVAFTTGALISVILALKRVVLD